MQVELPKELFISLVSLNLPQRACGPFARDDDDERDERAAPKPKSAKTIRMSGSDIASITEAVQSLFFWASMSACQTFRAIGIMVQPCFVLSATIELFVYVFCGD